MVCIYPHKKGGKGTYKACSGHYRTEIHACLWKHCRLHKYDVGVRHKCGDAGYNFFFNRCVVFAESENLFYRRNLSSGTLPAFSIHLLGLEPAIVKVLSVEHAHRIVAGNPVLDHKGGNRGC